MTPKQIQRLETKIADIKRILAAEKRQYGGYDDSRGLRYLPTRYYIQLGDYAGGLRYTRWFAKAFADDVGFPDFLFEWTLILFKNGKLADAGPKAWQTFCSHPDLLDYFLGQPIGASSPAKKVGYAHPGIPPSFAYSSQQAELSDFGLWLEEFMSCEPFIRCRTRYLAIAEQLQTETDQQTRLSLLQEAAYFVEGIALK